MSVIEIAGKERRPNIAVRGTNNFETLNDFLETPRIAAHNLTNCSVVGCGYIISDSSENPLYKVDSDLFFPGYIENFTNNANTETMKKRRNLIYNYRSLESIKVETCFTAFHYNVIYGHYLIEILPRIIAIDQLQSSGLDFPICIPKSVPEWAKRHTKALFPRLKSFEFDDWNQKLDAQRLIAISGDPIYTHSWATAKYHGLAAAATRNKKLFLKRPHGYQAYGRVFANESEIAEIAAGYGFEVVDPSNLPIKDQAELFSQANLVAGEFNSALHNTVFCGHGTAVIAINRLNIVQWRIAQANGHYLDYIEPLSGTVGLSDARQYFSVDPSRFAIAIENANAYISGL